MGIVLAFIIGCLVTIWWKAKPNNKEPSMAAEQVISKGNQYLNKAKRRLREAGQIVPEIHATRISNRPVIDEALKEVLLEYAIDQVKKGKIKIVEDID